MTATIERLAHIAQERGIDFVLIGGNAVILSGFARSTIDIDLMICTSHRSRWLDVMREIGYRLFNGTPAFSQFECPSKQGPAIDLMYVAEPTWAAIRGGAILKNLGTASLHIPRPEHIVALKLHAAKSPTRSKPETDWEDIRQIVQTHRLKISDPAFRALVEKHGSGDAVARIVSFENP